MNPFNLQSLIVQTEQEGLVTRTFRRLDPEKQMVVIESILDDAVEVGPDQIRIQKIAQKAGVSVGSMYQYFPDRDHLLKFAIKLCIYSWMDLFSRYTPMIAAMPLRDGLRSYLSGGLELGRTEKGVVQFFGRAAYQGNQGKLKAGVEIIADELLKCIHEILKQAQLRGEIRADLDLITAARTVNVLLIALGDSQLFPYLNDYYKLTDIKMSFEQIVETSIDMILQGFGTHPMENE